MAIQPIDLSNMYSQISNVARTEAGYQSAQVAGAVQQVVKGQQDLENSTKVQITSNDNSKSDSVNSNGRGNSSSGGYFHDQSKKQDQQEENDFPPRKADPTPLIGSIIDITR